MRKKKGQSGYNHRSKRGERDVRKRKNKKERPSSALTVRDQHGNRFNRII